MDYSRDIEVVFHRPKSEKGIEKIKSACVWSKQWKWVNFFFQLIELGYEKFPHNTTVSS